MTPARRLVFLNGHGGNSALVNVANRELRLHHGLMTFLAHPGLPPDQGGVVAGRRARHGHPRRHRRDVAHAAPGARARRHVDGRAPRPRAPRRQPLRPLRRRRCRSAGCPTTSATTASSATRPAATAERGAELFAGAVDAFCARAARDRRLRVPAVSRRRRASDLRVDGDRLWARLVELGEIGAIKGPERRGGLRPPRPHRRRPGRAATSSSAGCATSASTSPIDAIGNVVATRPGTDPTAAPVMTGSHIDTVATGGRFDGNLGVLAGLEVDRDARAARRRDRRTRSPSPSSPTRRAPASRPTCSAASCSSAAWPLEEALDVARRRRRRPARRRAGPHRLRRPAAVPDGARAARLRRAAHRAGPDPRGRGRRRSASSRACRASRGPS